MAFFDDLSKKINDATSSAAQKSRDNSEISKLKAAVAEEETKVTNAYIQIGKLYCANHSEDIEECYAIFADVVKESEKKIAAMKAQIRQIRGVTACTKCGNELPNNVAFCSFCGTPAPAPKVDPNVTICPGCKAAVPKGMRFCTSCGFRIPDAQPAEPAPAPVQNGYAPQPAYVPEPAPIPVPSPIQEPQQTYVPDSEPAVTEINFDAADASRFVMQQENIVIPDIAQDTYVPEAAQQFAGKTCSNCGKTLAEGMLFCTECGQRV